MGQELKGEISFDGNPQVLKQGEVIGGMLKVWPIENADLNEFKKLENMTLGKGFYVTDVENIVISPNNADVVEVKLLFIVKESKESSIESLSYKGQQVNLSVPSTTITQSKQISKDYFIVDQKIPRTNTLLISILMAVSVLMIFLIFKRVELVRFINSFRNDPKVKAKNYFNQKFLNAATRSDFESIYSERSQWIDLLKEVSPPYHDFFMTMEKHQYKRIWINEELLDVKNSFELIKESFK
jgi:hypothetical protein